MQLMGYGISIFGSRFGLAFDPVKKRANLIRYDKHPGLPFEISAGFELDGHSVLLPLVSKGETFQFCDFDTTATSMRMVGIDSKSGIRIGLRVLIPFCPRDVEFSVTPAIFMDLECERIQNDYRWVGMENRDKEISGKFFIEFKNIEDSQIFRYIPKPEEKRIKVEYKSPFRDLKKEPIKHIDCRDYIDIYDGLLEDKKIFKEFSLKPGQRADCIKLAFVTYDEPILQVLGEKVPFKYHQYFKSIEEVSGWARNNRKKVIENGKRVDRIFSIQTIGQSYTHLMLQSLHTWLINTWFTVRSNGQDWFSCWEGNCYFHSTVDVEYTQTPFYLSFWPELLELLLNQWCYYTKLGTVVRGLGKKGEGTAVMSHDMGEFTQCNTQIYPHDMPIEENANYILMMFVHYLRTGKKDTIIKHLNLLKGLMDFILACDSKSNGIPDLGTANTIDDGSPAIQYCSEQIYLGVKAMSAVKAGAMMLSAAGEGEQDKYREYIKRAVNTIENKGWNKDHYIVTTNKSLDGMFDSWSDKPVSGAAEGWDAYHIYASNGLALLDMCGFKTELNEEHIKTDLEMGLAKTELKYGSSHSAYRREDIAGHPSKIGWISMNMLRDISSAYRGIDSFKMIESYWDWQLTSNTQEYMGFHETFYGNTLCFYPRGIACFGYMEAILGFEYSPVLNKKSFAPVRSDIRIPLLLFADWKKGTVPVVTTKLKDQKITFLIDNFI